MASSVSGQDEAISAVIEYSSERRGANLPARDYPLCPARKIYLKAEFFIGQDCSVKMAGHWPHVFLRVYGLPLGLFIGLPPADVHTQDTVD